MNAVFNNVMPKQSNTSLRLTSTRTRERQRGRSNLSLIIGLSGLALVSGAIIWGFFADEPWGSAADNAEVSSTTPVEAYTPIPSTDIVAALVVEEPPPAEPEPEPVPEPAPEPIPAVALIDSDEPVRAAIQDLGAGAVAEQFATASNLVERAVSLADNLAAGSVPYKLIPIARPKTAFPVNESTTGTTVDPAGYARFDGLADWVNSLDAQALVALYREFEPAADEAYALLGYGEGNISERIDRGLRLILTAPDVPSDAALVKREAVWVYADEALENLPDLHKQLLRLGPDNLRKIQDKAREISFALEDSSH